MPLSRSLTPAQRTLLALGVITAASGVLHVGVWLAVGQPSLVGPVTWRKPIVFGLSIGVLAFSLAWVVRLLPDTRGLARQARWLLWLFLAELLLIDVQQWRGVGSHFNVVTPLDGAIFQAMGALILAAAGILAWWTWRLFREPRTDRPREALTAARAGMLFLAAGNAIGIGLVVWGNVVLTRTGLPPAAFGMAGDLKMPHALALHGLQVLPLLAVLAAPLPREAQRRAAVRLAAAGYAMLVAGTLWQALAGRAPSDVIGAPMALALAGALLVAAPVARALWARRPRQQQIAEGA